MSKKEASIATKLSNSDVLLEKGLRGQQNPGNIKYREIVQEKALEYSMAFTRKEKETIALSVYYQVRGKFLTRLDGKYYVASKEQVVLKIKQALRDRNKSKVLTRVQKYSKESTKPRKPSTEAGEKGKERERKSNEDSTPIPLDRISSPSKSIVIDDDMKKMLDIIKKL